ncbi:MAG TPA: hypothetical protein VHK91_07200 [Flavisolibacter sp.]|jgi:hypothetical protein|nr:hypothetical protein [Flavisolibacter sp.]
MVQTDVSQLSTECTEWRQILRNYKDEFQECKKVLQEICRNTLPKDQLLEVEHFDNQFHIQLINIHDLKQLIKHHERRAATEADSVSEETYSEHEHLLTDFLALESTLQELRQDFKQFIGKVSCG